MFLTDREKGLSEMRRVLRDNGCIALSVWQGIDRHPFMKAMDLAMRQRLGGFRRVDIKALSKTHRFPDPERFLASGIETAAAALPSLQALDAQQRRNIVDAISQDMTATMREVTEGDHIVLPWHAYVVRAEP
jgi:hypothetical protein